MQKREVLLAQFDAAIGRYSEFAVRVRDLVAELLHEQQINIHSVTARVKQRDSFERKIRARTRRTMVLSL